MSDQMCAPRVTATYLNTSVGRLVTMVGKVTQLRGDQAVLEADGAVNVALNHASYLFPSPHLTFLRITLRRQDSNLTNGNAAQIIGKVNPDLSIKALSSRDLGAGVDFTLCTAVVEATHRHKDIFISGA
ncbi:hypothetical protein CDD80_2898 [Ophiocordyceps camponoti-rufipedis]|uniref:Replication factor A protein 3 n=1 Tax=Ophiocordyceps camponoti-rufipedis TaxID=2004952 RepID=A0A2C5Z4G4_9HYPO|nr:hypothetical protein CDD80_2898 [Ophiocordyceps camponoti-rufipedis]